MWGVREATISGYNAFLDKLEAELGAKRSYVSTLLFDQSEGRPLVRPLEIGQPIAWAERLSTAIYGPNGMTPPYDAIAKTIHATDEVVEREKATRVFLVLQTDGGENASRDFAGEPGRKKVTAMLEERKKRGWQIVSLAADLSAQYYQMSAGLGLGAGQTIAYGKGRTHEAFGIVAASDSVAFDLAQKAEAGDPTADPGRPISTPPSAPPGPMPDARRASRAAGSPIPARPIRASPTGAGRCRATPRPSLSHANSPAQRPDPDAWAGPSPGR